MNFLWINQLSIYCLFWFFSPQSLNEFDIARRNILENYQKFQAEKEIGAKTYTFDVTTNGFIRYKKILKDSKTEYYSVKADKITDVSYLGTEISGWLIINCEKESIIYQTYHDQSGDIDEMISQIKIPIKQINIDKINSWSNDFIKIKFDVEIP